jgi:hypothetical protein
VAVFSNVTLGAANFELDKVVVVPHARRNSDAEPRIDPTQQLGEPALEPVLVLGIVEAKSNINDLGYSFAHFQNTLKWLCGKERDYGYDAGERVRSALLMLLRLTQLLAVGGWSPHLSVSVDPLPGPFWFG